jgi:putative phage-type endonuclease
VNNNNNRSRFIGSSDISAIIGIDKYRTPYQVWAEKVGAVTGFEGNRATRLGQILEPIVAEFFAEDTGCEVEIWRSRVTHEIHDMISCEPDYKCKDPFDAVFKDGILECKTGNYRLLSDWEKDGNPPDNYQIQVQWQLACTKKPWGFICGMLGNSPDELRIRKIYADKILQNKLINIACEFWNKYVVTGTPPLDLIESKDKEVINQVIKEVSENEREADFAEQSLLDELDCMTKKLEEARASIEALTDEQLKLNNQLKLKLAKGSLLYNNKRFYLRHFEEKEVKYQRKSYVQVFKQKVK